MAPLAPCGPAGPSGPGSPFGPLDPITTMGGLRTVPDTTIGELKPQDSSMLVLPGAATWLTGGNSLA